MKHQVVILSCSLAIAFSSMSFAGENKVPYPEGYRDWSHIKTMVIEPGHALENPFQGIHHVYGNKKAKQGLKDGKYANGSVLVFDLLKYTQKDKAIQESDRKLVGVMHKNTDKYSSTGGWGFEGFAGNSKTERLTNDGGASCYGCHVPQKSTDYVFSALRK